MMTLLSSTALLVVTLSVHYAATPIAAAAMESSEQHRVLRDCPPKNPAQDKYGFETLLAVDVWAVHGQPCQEVAKPNGTDCSYYFTFCQKLPEHLSLHENCSDASVCVVNDVTAETRNIGTASSFFYENRAGLNRDGKFEITYTVAGTRILTSLDFTCNRSASWYNAPTSGNESYPLGLIGKVHTYDDMVAMMFQYDGACLNVTSTVVPPASTSPVVPPASTALTGGAIFAIVLFVLIGVYIFGGMLVNMLLRNKTGIEAFPNYNTWSSVSSFIGAKLRGGSSAEKQHLVGGGYGSTGASGEGGSLVNPQPAAGGGGGGKGSTYEDL